jgi:hypothetical protein
VFISLESLLRLGWSFGKTVVKNRLVKAPQLPRVQAQYGPDGMLSASPGDHETLVAAGRCTHCCRCDVRALETDIFTPLGPRGHRAFVQGVSRRPGLDGTVGPEATAERLRDLSLHCPVEVPFVALAALVRRRYDEHRALVAPVVVRAH